MDEQKTSPWQSLSPKQIFLFGAMEGFLALCTIGFFILVYLLFKGGIDFGSLSFAKNVNDNSGGVQANVNQGAEQQPEKITLRAVDAKRDHIRGNKNAKVSVVVYSDFECPFCKSFHNTMKQVVDAYKQDVRWVYRQFPLEGLHRQAKKEALASECASEQGKFWEFADLIFQETPSNDGLDLAKLPEYARRLNLDVNQFNVCLNSEKYASVISEDENDGQSAGARGTPYSVIVGPKGETIPVSGALPFASIKSSIDSVL